MEQMQSVLVDKCQARQFETSHQVDASAAIAARPTMTIEQEEALRHVCEEPGAVKIIDGVAGTGRRYLLSAAREAWETAGFEVVGPALSCAAGLGSGAGHSLLFQLDTGECRLSSKSVVVIDEAGIMDSRRLERILDHVHQAGAKAVIVGDSRQPTTTFKMGTVRGVDEDGKRIDAGVYIHGSDGTVEALMSDTPGVLDVSTWPGTWDDTTDRVRHGQVRMVIPEYLGIVAMMQKNPDEQGAHGACGRLLAAIADKVIQATA